MHKNNEAGTLTSDRPQTKSSAQKVIEQLLQPAGITLNGSNPYDIQIYNEDFYKRVIAEGSLGLGESYMDKWWECEQIDVFFDKLLTSNIESRADLPLKHKFKILIARLVNMQSKIKAKEVAELHYDLDNTLFSKMLDKHMIYSCGYWKDATTLEEAQEAKLELICQKLELKPGMTLLDIGCGWGGLARYAAENYSVKVTGVTISKQQCEFGKEFCKGLPVDIRVQDYRDIDEKFDSVVSVGMFEHVGYKNYATFMQTVHNTLKDQGLFLLHTIGNNETMYTTNEWTSKYIFPNGMLPSIAQIAKSSEKLLVMEDWQNFGADYDKTLMAWHQNFNNHWDELKSKYDERFYRMWTFYLLMSAGAFRARDIQLWQVVFSRGGIEGTYMSPR